MEQAPYIISWHYQNKHLYMPMAIKNNAVNVKSRLWGPHLWKSLHAMSLGYPETPSPHCKKHYQEFFHSLQYVLPCTSCRRHYARLIKSPTSRLGMRQLRNRESLMRWLVKIHNAVNRRKNKKCMSFKQVQQLYNSWVVRSKGTPSN